MQRYLAIIATTCKCNSVHLCYGCSRTHTSSSLLFLCTMPMANVDRRAVVVSLLALFTTKPSFRQAVDDFRSLLVDQASGRTHTRPDASRGLSSWLGQRAADLHGSDTSLIHATVRDIDEHLTKAYGLSHPLDNVASRLPPDVKAAAQWLLSHHQPPVPQPGPALTPLNPAPSPRPIDASLQNLRRHRMDRIEQIAASLEPLEHIVQQAMPLHVKKMLAYTPRTVLIHAIATATDWPDANLASDMCCGLPPTGAMPDTGVFRLDDEAVCPESFSALCAKDPHWNRDLVASIAREAQDPDKAKSIQDSWDKTQKECAVGWCTPVGGGLAELNARYGEGLCRAMRRFGVEQNGGTRVCDNAAKSGHNKCTGHPERIVCESADFPIEAAGLFASILGLDGTWSMNTATCDVVAAYRRLACGDPSRTVVAQWDPRPRDEGGQRVAFFYVHGFNFGLKSAVLGYYRWSEFQTRAAVRLLPLVCCHYVDDWCIAEPTFCGSEGQHALLRFARLLGVHFDAVPYKDRLTGQQRVLPAKRQSPAFKRVFLGVETDFSNFASSGRIFITVPQPRIDKIVAMLEQAISTGELHAGVARKLCGKLQFVLGWASGRFGRAALQPLYRRAEQRYTKVGLALEMALNFLLHAIKSLTAREVCINTVGAGPPVLVWSDAMYKTAYDKSTDGDVIVEDGQLGFVVRFPGGMRGPSDAPHIPPPEHPRFVHGALACGPEVIAELEARKQQIGQLELLGAVAPYFSLAPYLKGRRVIHWIDNTAALAGIAKGYSSKPDSARIIHSFHALGLSVQADVHFEYVASEANVADLPSRGEFEFLTTNLGSTLVPLRIPPLSNWLSPEDAAAHARPTSPKTRGGKRSR